VSDLEAAERRWHDWIEEACASVGVDPAQVDVRRVHALTKVIAHQFDRPMAPVGAYILGIAVGQHGSDADLAALTAALEQTVRRRPVP
jgi:hypothetical protein